VEPATVGVQMLLDSEHAPRLPRLRRRHRAVDPDTTKP